MNEKFAFLIVVLTAAVVYFLIRSVFMNEMKTEEAIGLLLDKGVVVEYRGYHLYKSQRSQTTIKYTILRFDAQGKLFYGQDEDFDIPLDAIRKFMKKTELA